MVGVPCRCFRGLAGECNVAGEAPELHEVLADVCWQLPTPAARQGHCRHRAARCVSTGTAPSDRKIYAVKEKTKKNSRLPWWQMPVAPDLVHAAAACETWCWHDVTNEFCNDLSGLAVERVRSVNNCGSRSETNICITRMVGAQMNQGQQQQQQQQQQQHNINDYKRTTIRTCTAAPCHEHDQSNLKARSCTKKLREDLLRFISHTLQQPCRRWPPN